MRTLGEIQKAVLKTRREAEEIMLASPFPTIVQELKLAAKDAGFTQEQQTKLATICSFAEEAFRAWSGDLSSVGCSTLGAKQYAMIHEDMVIEGVPTHNLKTVEI